MKSLVHTYSILAIDQQQGLMGGAVQSHWFNVGKTVLWGKTGVGMMASQSVVNPSFGTRGMSLMETGKSLGFFIEN